MAPPLPACLRRQTFRIYVLFNPAVRERLAHYVKPRAYTSYITVMGVVVLVVWSVTEGWGPTRRLTLCLSRWGL